MENEIKQNIILGKKLEDRYGSNNGNLDNFTTPDELKVTITLNEYRQLVLASQKQELSKCQQEANKANIENYELKKKLAALQELIKISKPNEEQNNEEE